MVGFLFGGGRGGSAFRALANDAAVGANKPDEGVLGRVVEGCGADEGVLTRTVDGGVFAGVVDDDLVDEEGTLARDGVVVFAGVEVLELVPRSTALRAVVAVEVTD